MIFSWINAWVLRASARRQLYTISFFLFSVFPVMACDVCVAPTTGDIGASLFGFNQSFIEASHSLSLFELNNGNFSTYDKFHRVQIRGQYALSEKWAFSASVPWNASNRVSNESVIRVREMGEIQFNARRKILSKTSEENSEFALFGSVGVSLPTRFNSPSNIINLTNYVPYRNAPGAAIGTQALLIKNSWRHQAAMDAQFFTRDKFDRTPGSQLRFQWASLRQFIQGKKSTLYGGGSVTAIHQGYDRQNGVRMASTGAWLGMMGVSGGLRFSNWLWSGQLSFPVLQQFNAAGYVSRYNLSMNLKYFLK